MDFNVTILKKRLRQRRLVLKRAIERAKESGYAFHEESQILRASHIALIDEILKMIKELEN